MKNINQRSVGLYLSTTILFLFGVLSSLLLFSPGWVSIDSINQFQQAKTGNYTDWHPVLQAYWLNILSKTGTGTFLIFLQSVLFYWFAFFLFSISEIKKFPFWSLAFYIVAFLPSNLLNLAMIWKDVSAATGLLLIFSIIYFQHKRNLGRNWFLLASIFLLSFWSVGVKPNAILVIPVAIAYYLSVVEKKQFKVNKKLFAIAIVSVSFATFGMNHLVSEKVSVTKSAQYQYILIHDLIGISYFSNKDVFPEYISELATTEEIHEYYKATDNDSFISSYPDVLKFPPDKDLDNLALQWIGSVVGNPKEYLQHRANVSSSLLRIGYSVPRTAIVPQSIDNDGNLISAESKAVSFLSASEGQILLWSPWLILVTSISVLFFSVILRRKLSSDYWYLLAGSYIFLIPHFFLAPAGDFRYLLFSMITLEITVIIGCRDLVYGKKSVLEFSPKGL